MIIDGMHYLGEGHCKNCTKIFNQTVKPIKEKPMTYEEQVLNEFNKTFGVNGQRGKTYLALDEVNIKSFISSALKKQREFIVERIKQMPIKTVGNSAETVEQVIHTIRYQI